MQESWKKILATKPKRVCYGHARAAVLEEVTEQKNAELYDTVKKMMQLIDKGASIDKIASKLKVDREFVSDVCRMYLTHRNVGVQGILDRIEIKGR